MDEKLRLLLLKVILFADGVVLTAIGLGLMFATGIMFDAFGFIDMPAGVYYIVSMWGALMATMGIGYLLASRDPAASTTWVLTGLARAALEVGVSVAYMVGGHVSAQNALFGAFLAAWFALAYLVLFPWRRKKVGEMEGAA